VRVFPASTSDPDALPTQTGYILDVRQVLLEHDTLEVTYESGFRSCSLITGCSEASVGTIHSQRSGISSSINFPRALKAPPSVRVVFGSDTL